MIQKTIGSLGRRLIIAFAVLFAPAMPVPPAAAAEPVVSVGVENFTWREFILDLQGNDRQVKESGLRYIFGIVYPVERGEYTITPRAELFWGEVDYDTLAFRPSDPDFLLEEAKTEVDYLGFRLESDVGRNFRLSQDSLIQPFGGVGFRVWSREIQPGTTAAGTRTAGSTEDWFVLYGRLGVRGHAAWNTGRQVFGEAGVILPFYNENTPRDIDLTLYPGRVASYFAEGGIALGRTRVSLFYDSLRFSQSPTETDGRISAYQPRSEMDVYGIRFGMTF